MTQLARDQRKSELIAAYVEPATRDRLLELARSEDRTVSAAIRRAVDRELGRHRDDKEAEA